MRHATGTIPRARRDPGHHDAVLDVPPHATPGVAPGHPRPDARPDPDDGAATARRRVALFVGLLAALTAVLHATGLPARSPQVGSLLTMWTPGLAALAAGVFTSRRLSAMGWRVRPARWLVVGWATPVVYAAAAYAAVWLSGLGGFGNPGYVEHGRRFFGLAGRSDGAVLAVVFGWVAVVGLAPGVVLSLGEEIGWRGFLVPELSRWLGFRRAALASGLLWAAWHLPGVLTGAYGAGPTPLGYRLACFGMMVVSTGVVLAWLRMRSGSIWPAAVMHAAHNGIIQGYLGPLTTDTGPTAYVAGEFGAALLPFTVGLAWAVWRRAGHRAGASACA
jgi:membrane protease YdiL (CAAX protease family)